MAVDVQHWLVTVARRAGLPGATSLSLPSAISQRLLARIRAVLRRSRHQALTGAGSNG